MFVLWAGEGTGMGVSEEIQEELRNGRSPEEILERLKAKGLSETNGRRFIERAQVALSAGGSAQKPTTRPAARPVAPLAAGDEEGDGTWTMVQGAFFFTLGAAGSAVTYVLARPGGRVALYYGAILWGFGAFIVGLRRWSATHGSRPFPALAVGISVAIPGLFAGWLYFKTDNSRTEQRQAAVQMVRDEEKRRGVAAPAAEAAPALDPVSTYIVVLRNGGATPDAQREAAWRLGEMRAGAIDAVPVLLTALKSPDTRVRAGSAEALMKIDGGNPAVTSAVKALMNDPSRDVWGPVMGVFMAKGDADATRALVAQTTSPEPSSRAKACEMLGSPTGNASVAAPAIIALLKVEGVPYVLSQCAHSLGNLGQGSPEAIAVLESILATPKPPEVTRTVNEVLEKLKKSRK
jgi:hypothetical protein